MIRSSAAPADINQRGDTHTLGEGKVLASEHTILASDLRVIERFVLGRGDDVETLLRATHIAPDLLKKPRERVPALQVGALLEELARQYPGRALGLELATCHRITDTHVLGITAISSETTLAALRRLSQYQALVSTQEPLRLDENKDTITITKSAVQTAPAEHIIQSFLFAVLLTAVREISGFSGDIVSVSFTGKPMGEEAAYRQIFGPRVAFSAKHASMVFPRDVLEKPISTSNVDILTRNEPMLASLVRSVRENSLPANIKMAILDRLPEHTLTEDEAAAANNMSLRTFQRRLESEGTRFRVLLDQTRTHLAESLLADATNTLAEVGFYCGFSEQASFSRAFKLWTGKTPSAYRAKLLEDAV
ncbi:MAG: AraC family transcriptional regulator ligand-binding domain-containing protein [Luminiphilus sp.]